jgi:hypothetical protein
MTQEHLETLLTVKQQGDGIWIAMVPEIPMMWAKAATRQAAIDQWANEYDKALVHPILASCLRERVAASKPLGSVTVTEEKQ